VYSQLSFTKFSECPMRRFPPIEGSIPPTNMVGSQLPASRIWEIMDVVVVFPCVPATLMALLYSFIISPRKSARTIIGMPACCAAINSGLSLWMAAVYTTKSISGVIFSDFWPYNILAPESESLFVSSLALASEPLTWIFFSIRISASALMLMPPIPIK